MRMCKAKSAYAQQRNAAIKIQCLTRQRAALFELEYLGVRKLRQMESSATKIQALVRGSMARASLDQKHSGTEGKSNIARCSNNDSK
eukprot:8413035-Ditylum_brightwellii.AAC.1